jgi:hypothetical protein
MDIDLSLIKNESLVKFDKSLKKVKDKFFDMLLISLNTIAPNIEVEVMQNIELALSDLFNDEANKYKVYFTSALNKASDIVENSLKGK